MKQRYVISAKVALVVGASLAMPMAYAVGQEKRLYKETRKLWWRMDGIRQRSI